MAGSAALNKTLILTLVFLMVATFGCDANRRSKGRISKEFDAKVGATGGTGAETRTRNHRRGKCN